MTSQGPTAERDAEIYRRRQTGETFRSIAAAYGISPTRVQQIFIKEAWKRRQS